MATFNDTRESMSPFLAPPQSYTGDREALYRMTRRSRRVGSTAQERAGEITGYTTGVGRQAAQTAPRQTTEEWKGQFDRGQIEALPNPPSSETYTDPFATRRRIVAQSDARFTNPDMSPEQSREAITAGRTFIESRQLNPFAGMRRNAGGQIVTPYGTVGKNWQADLVTQHPDLGVKDSPANKEFVRVYRATQDRNAALEAANLAREGFASL